MRYSTVVTVYQLTWVLPNDILYSVQYTYRLDEGVVAMERCGAFPDCERLTEDSVAKLKRSQLNVCTVYSFPPAAEIFARLACN